MTTETMHTLEPIIKELPIFKGLGVEQLELITGCASNERFGAGEMIFREGEPADKFYIVRSGRVAVEILVPGHGPITVETVEAGEVIGWSWLFEPYVRRFNARSVELTRVIAMDGKCLRGKCDRDTALGYELMRRFARIMQDRLQAMLLQLIDVYAK
jgi:CRP-like cAMP-binding protein